MLRYSMKDLLYLFVVAALILGWWAERHNREPPAARFQMQLLEANQDVYILDTATGQVWYNRKTGWMDQKVK